MLSSISLRFYVYAALFALSIAFFLRYDYLAERVKQQDDVIHKYEDAFNKQQQQIKDADLARTEYLKQIEDGKNEIDTLRNSVNSGATGLRVKASCPKQNAIVTDTAGVKAAAPELDRDAEQDYYAILEGIRTVEARYSLCIKTLEDEHK